MERYDNEIVIDWNKDPRLINRTPVRPSLPYQGIARMNKQELKKWQDKWIIPADSAIKKWPVKYAIQVKHDGKNVTMMVGQKTHDLIKKKTEQVEELVKLNSNHIEDCPCIFCGNPNNLKTQLIINNQND